MKKILMYGLISASVLVAGEVNSLVKINENISSAETRLINKMKELKGKIEEQKQKLIAQIKKETKEEKADYDSVVKNFNFFKLKHKDNIYAIEQIKSNSKKLKSINKDHLNFQKRNLAKLEQLSYKSFIPEVSKPVQEELFFYEIKYEEFTEISNVNKKRLEKSIKDAKDRFRNDSDILLNEFKEITYKAPAK